ncbi:MAG TPA: Holliday junction branch migration protein RuvA [Ktedonobacteraceae bacterium]|nr:Holliday junction branch migration protein RuvA [Ktedonobacteraceae bacterium]
MITNIHGILEERKADAAIIRVGGFSLRVFAPALTLNALGEAGAEVSLHTHFHMREDGIALYGFTNEEERDAFEQLIGVSGVGPKVALALLSVMDARALFRAIAEGDEKRLALVPGVGKRTAERLVLELKRKLPALAAATGGSSSKMQAEVLEALMGLGFSASEAQKALAKIPQDQEMTLEQQITYALRSFSRE